MVKQLKTVKPEKMHDLAELAQLVCWCEQKTQTTYICFKDQTNDTNWTTKTN